MNWFTRVLTSSIGRKVLMALTGLFLSLFLVVHLIGNLQLLAGDEGAAFNAYAAFMTTTPIVKVASYLLYATFLLHIVQSILLTMHNRSARPVGYRSAGSSQGVSSTSRNMGILGTIILVFLIIHLRNFWYEMHWGEITTDAAGNKDLYKVVSEAFAQWWYVALYIVSMVGVGFHLWHGFASSFQTLGLNHAKYTPFIKSLGYGFAILIPLGFALIPIIMFVQSGN
ncbi:MAG: succinate dehydrogenase cytochrome b subunit [Bernardetiaceae bacterium]|nr:succinate dehydrogenase cytochrome b subunit [Bernardetiaceae bacterium]